MTKSMFFILYHIAQGLIGGVEKPYYSRKTPLGVGGTRTQVLADSMAIAGSAH